MRIPLFQIDAFTSRVFGGNAAAVCPLEAWLPEAQMQAIAAENQLSETAFFVGRGGHYELRWFTPTAEVDLCGHATLAAAFVLFTAFGIQEEELVFITRSGPLKVRQKGTQLQLDFPAWDVSEYVAFAALSEALGAAPEAVYASGSRDYLAVYASEAQVRALRPEMDELMTVDRLGVAVTAPGDTADFVSRYFCPRLGIAEDPVTGSAHCGLTPYWAKRLGKTQLTALQVSARQGELGCELRGERVLLTGSAVKYSEGLIELPDFSAPRPA